MNSWILTESSEFPESCSCVLPPEPSLSRADPAENPWIHHLKFQGFSCPYSSPGMEIQPHDALSSHLSLPRLGFPIPFPSIFKIPTITAPPLDVRSQTLKLLNSACKKWVFFPPHPHHEMLNQEISPDLLKSKQIDNKEPLKESSLCLSLSSVTHGEVMDSIPGVTSCQDIKSLSKFFQSLKYKSLLPHQAVLVLAVPKNVTQFHWWHLFNLVWSMSGIFYYGILFFGLQVNFTLNKIPGCRLSPHGAALPTDIKSLGSSGIILPWLKFSGKSLALP